MLGRRLVLVVIALTALTAPWLARVASALEPATVRVEGTAPIREGNAARARDLAFKVALQEAVLEVARLYVAPGELEVEQERLREALAEGAPDYVLTYQIHGSPVERPSSTEPGELELVVDLTATVDAGQVRQALQSLGLLSSKGDRPSLVLVVRGASPSSSSPLGLYNSFEEYLVRALEQEGYVIVDPALTQTQLGRRPLDLARALGADVSVDVAVSWSQRDMSSRLVGGVADVRVRAQRAKDGSQLATATFNAPAYHEAADEALLRALEALRAQVADSLVLQLGRNWQVLSRDDGPVRLQLLNVTSFLQVESVQGTLTDVLGAQDASLLELGPHSAELRVRSPLSAGALQDRLAAFSFEGFALEPVDVQGTDVRLRVQPRALPTAPQEGP